MMESLGEEDSLVMAGLVPAIHLFEGWLNRGCPAQGRA